MSSTEQAWEMVRVRAGIPGVKDAYGYDLAGQPSGVHRGLPSRTLTFLISLDEPTVVATSEAELGRGRGIRSEVCVSGLHLSPAYLRQPDHRRQRGIQLAVHPLAARRLFGLPAGALTALVQEGHDVLGPAAAELRERMHELGGWLDRFTALEGYLGQRLAATEDASRVVPEVTRAWRLLEESRGGMSVSALAADVGYSARQLTKLFRSELGIGPKAAGRLMRFDHLISVLSASVRAGSPPRLAEAAAQCGYYDQAHANAEFRAFTGTTPSGWLAEEFRNIQSGGHGGGQY